MLTQLHIENFALIDNLTIDFSPRLNVLTGETGAGKSILIDAIRFVLGERMEGVRTGNPECASSVEAAFELRQDFLSAYPVFEPYLGGGEGLLILRREANQGKTRCWVNNRLVILSSLKEIGANLIDIHGQYDHQLLLDSGSHLDLIDRLAKIEDLKKEYRVVYEKYRLLLDQEKELVLLKEGRERELDLLKYQIDEIKRAGLGGIHEEELIREKSRLANAERLHEMAAHALSLLEEGEVAASGLIAEAFRDIQGLAGFDDSLGPLKGDYGTMQLGLEEIIRTLKIYQENLTFDPDRLKEVEKKLDLADHLKRKYGGSLQAVHDFLAKAEEKYERLANSEIHQKEIRQKIKEMEPVLSKGAVRLTEKRGKVAYELKRVIESELRDLNIPHARFEPQMQEIPFSPRGKDQMEFLIGLNVGQPVFPLKKIISGGEASRVMLAMKKALMNADPVPTLIFDEIDTNIGGRLGSVTGRKLKDISKERQVLLITHLPQIASFADRHIQVTKAVQKGRTSVKYEILEGDQRVRELAQMMSGKKETEISKKHAEEMLSHAS